MEYEYICSETAVKRILNRLGKNISIADLKVCESLESMIPCVQYIKGVTCSLRTVEDVNDIIKELHKHKDTGIAARIELGKPCDNLLDIYGGTCGTWLHTIRLTDYDQKTGMFSYDDDTGKGVISKSDLERIMKNYIFECEKNE